MNGWQITLGLFGSSSVSIVVGAVLTGWFNRGKTRSDAAQAIADGAAVLVVPLTEQLEKAQGQLKETQTQMASMQVTLAHIEKKFDAVLDAVVPLTELAEEAVQQIHLDNPSLASRLRAASEHTRLTIAKTA